MCLTRHTFPVGVNMPEDLPDLQQLYQLGAFSKGVTIFADVDGKRATGTILPDGCVMTLNKEFASLSVAAGVAITMLTGRTTIDRAYASVNGWKFWQYQLSDNRILTLDELRRMFAGQIKS